MDAPYANRHGMCRSVFLLAMAVCLAFFTAPLSAQTHGAGAVWLLEQQQQDGRISAGADETTPDHATFEAARALYPGYASSSEWVDARRFVDHEARSGIPWLPRRLMAATLAGDSVDELLAGLLERQNPDGGFGAGTGEASSLLDTLDALEALGAAGFRERSILQPAIGFVLAQQAHEGGFAHNRTSPNSAYLTARAIQALQRHQFEFGLSGPLGAARDHLESGLDRTPSLAAWEEAQALLALIPATPDPARYQTPLERLRGHQAPDGSWAGSVYATALAMRALQAADAAGAFSGGASSVLRGRVVDALGEAPVSGASITLEGTEGGVTVLSGADGQFQIEDLNPGHYTLRVAATGFQALSRDVDLSPGLLLDLGSVSIGLEPGTALVAGRVTDAETGQGLAATITQMGSESVSVTAAADGVYALPVTAGTVELSVAALGYQEVRATASAGAGVRLVFSPALSRETITDPGATVEAHGRVVDAVSLQPISGAAVRVSRDSAVAVSDAQGVFTVSGLKAGESALELLHASYQPAVVRFLATAGARVDLGDLRLQPNASAGTTVQGRVIDAYSGQPVIGAQVRVDDHVVETDGLGQYLIEQIQVLSFEVRAGAAGYRSGSRQIMLQQAGRVQLDFALEPTEIEGVRIAGFVAHAQNVGAFQEAVFSVGLENRADQERQVILSARVSGLDNGFREDFLVPRPNGDRGGAFPVAPGGSVLKDFAWFTGDAEPGTYEVRAQAWSADGTTLLAEAAVRITIAETAFVSSLGLVAEPRERIRGETAEVTLAAVIRNASNVDSVLEFSLMLRDPAGNPVHEQGVRLELPPSAAMQHLELAVLEHVFELAGTYALEVQALTGVPVGAVHTGQIVIAPNIRIEGSHDVEPERVPPLEDARVRIRLKIEGMEDGQ